MPNLGQIAEFNPETDDWDVYVERIELYCTANSVANDKKTAVLLTLVGNKAYTDIRALCDPAAPSGKSFDELVQLMRKTGLTPKPTPTAARHVFQERKQQAGESVSEFHLAIKRLSADCKFAGNLEDRLCDQLVSGLRCDITRTELFGKQDLTYKIALETALARECAERDAARVFGATASTTTSSDVHKIGQETKSTSKPFNRPQNRHKCIHCGKSNHASDNCFYRDATCHNCNKKGHIKPICRSSPNLPRRSRVHNVGNSDTPDPEDVQLHNIDTIHMNHVNRISPYMTSIVIENQPVTMEIDTGSSVSIMNKSDFQRLNIKKQVRPTDVVLSTYTKEKIRLWGVCTVDVQHGNQQTELDLYILDSTHQTVPLLGRPWMELLKLDWRSIKQISPHPEVHCNALKGLLHKHKALFCDELGTMKDIKATIKPKFLKARPVPLVLRPKVIQDIDRLVAIGVLTPVKYSEWATPIVPVIKGDGSIRICGDFRITVNPVLNVERYPQPRREDLFASLAGGISFSKVDLASAYLQMEVDEISKKYLTINTQKGLFRYNRLVFGIASAPAIFQRAIDTILQGIDGVVVYQDDILVTGKTQDEHIQRLSEVLRRLEEQGLRVKENKCSFLAPSLTYLGHVIDANGSHTIPSRIEAIKEAPIPVNVTQLRSFLGTINYYGSFIAGLSTKIAPLNNLLRSKVAWSWTPEVDAAFKEIKQCMCSAPVLAHYDPDMPLVIACDASPVGVAAVLSHRYPDGSERPVAFASRTLSSAERNYAQVDREALAVIYGVKKFNEYIYGQRFTLITDNRPVTYIFAPDKAIPSMAAARIQRWALYLGAFDYSIEFRPSSLHTNVDGLSRLPLNDTISRSDGDVFQLSLIETLPIQSEDIAKETARDPELSVVFKHTQNGWEHYHDYDRNNDKLRPYTEKRNELSIYRGCLMWGIRVIIPTKYRDQILDEIHSGHLGIVKMKAVARSYVYWPSIDAQIEQRGNGCPGCESVSKRPPLSPLHPWEWPSTPWRRIHIDFAGPFLNWMFLVVVDAHSKWPEVIKMRTATSATTIEALRDIFARFGVPDQIVSDNGSQFCSDEFQFFLKANGIKHMRSTPYHPSTNGLAERFVQTFKTALKSANATETTAAKHLASFLMAYRNAPHATTNASPALLMFRTSIRTRLDLLNPACDRRVLNKQYDQVMDRARKSRNVDFAVGDSVLVRDYRPNDRKWQTARVTEKSGPVSYKVSVPTGSGIMVWRRHADQMRHAVDQTSEIVNRSVRPPDSAPLNMGLQTSTVPVAEDGSVDGRTDGDPNVAPTPLVINPGPSARESTRVTRKPERLIESI